MTTIAESTTLARTFRRLACVAGVLLGVGSASRPLSAQLLAGLDTAGQVVVSRNEVRVYFPPPPSAARRWSVTPRAGAEPRLMMWTAQFDGATTIRLAFRDSSAPQSVPPLLSIVRAGRVSFCRENMVNSHCSSVSLAATLESSGVVLSYRDTAEIRQSFGLHPAAVMILVNLPAEMGDARIFAAPVRYIDPAIVLDSAERAAVGRERRRREATINSYRREIDGGSHGRTLSVSVGDSVDVLVQYYHCLVDVCSTYDFMDREPRDWGRWSLSDSTVATLHRSNVLDEASSGFPSNDIDRARKLVARRPGRAILRVSGVRTAADTMPSRTPLDSVPEREIIVMPAKRP